MSQLWDVLAAMFFVWIALYGAYLVLRGIIPAIKEGEGLSFEQAVLLALGWVLIALAYIAKRLS